MIEDDGDLQMVMMTAGKGNVHMTSVTDSLKSIKAANLNLKKVDLFAKLKLELKKITFLNSNSNKTVRVY